MKRKNVQVVRAAALVLALFLPVVAQAAKEKFVREKPHVNIGTIGHVDHASQSLSLTFSLLGLPRPSAGPADPAAAPRCTAAIAVRILFANDLTGRPFFEGKVELEQDGSQTVDIRPSTPADPSVPLLHEVTVKGEHIDGVHCIFRGAVEVRDDFDGRTSRLLPLKPEDFIALAPVRPSTRPFR